MALCYGARGETDGWGLGHSLNLTCNAGDPEEPSSQAVKEGREGAQALQPTQRPVLLPTQPVCDGRSAGGKDKSMPALGLSQPRPPWGEPGPCPSPEAYLYGHSTP